VQEDIQPELLKNIQIHYVRTIEEVLNQAFLAPVLATAVPQPAEPVV
jgi:hypothetical protein